MKTMKMAALAVVGLALAAPAEGGIKLTMTPTGQHNGLEVRVTRQLQKKSAYTCVHCTKYGIFGPRHHVAYVHRQ